VIHIAYAVLGLLLVVIAYGWRGADVASWTGMVMLLSYFAGGAKYRS
jgi:hypothetical protein